MDACPISFATKTQSSRSATYESSVWSFDVPNIIVLVTFDENMNVGALPADASFEVVTSLSARAPTIVSWDSPTTLRMTTPEGGSPPAFVTVEQVAFDENVSNADDNLTFPWGPETVPEQTAICLSAEWTHIDNKWDNFLTFSATMDTTVTPSAANLILQQNGVPATIASITWQNSHILKLRVAQGTPPSTPVTFELTTEDPNLHSLPGIPVAVFGPMIIPPA